MTSSSNSSSRLRSSRLVDPSKALEGREALMRLAANPDLEVFLQWLDWQKATALQPTDPNLDNWQVHASDKNGQVRIIDRIYTLFDNLAN